MKEVEVLSSLQVLSVSSNNVSGEYILNREGGSKDVVAIPMINPNPSSHYEAPIHKGETERYAPERNRQSPAKVILLTLGAFEASSCCDEERTRHVDL